MIKMIETKKINICDNVIDTLIKHIQKNDLSASSGGILIGEYNYNDDITITNVTNPMPEDIRKNEWFERHDKGHLDYFENIYNRYEDGIKYFGEWHTHPEAIPNLLEKDYKKWVKVKKDTGCDADFYHIIVGYEAFRIWKFNGITQEINLIKTIYWEEIEKI